MVASAGREEQSGDAAKCGEGKPLTAHDEDILAQLDGAACDADHDQRLEQSVVRAAQLVAIDHRDAKHELDLLLERIKGLARHGADGESRAEARRDRCSSADSAGCCDAAT